MTGDKWVYNGVEFSVGDRVQVFCTEEGFADNAMGEGRVWENQWVDDMNYSVGGIFEINSIEEEGVEFVNFIDEAPSLHPHMDYKFPLSVLAKV